MFPPCRGDSLPGALGRLLDLPAFIDIDSDGTLAAVGEFLYGVGRDGQPPEIGAICLDPDGWVDRSSLVEEGWSDDVPGQVFHGGLIPGKYPLTAEDLESEMTPVDKDGVRFF